MAVFIKALLLVVIAEMGDKTQLLAMAFACRYKVKDVMVGVFIATILNHALAVALGSYLSELIPLSYIQIAAAFSFIAFGLWTIRGDEIDGEDKKKSRFGPVVTVAIAFFIAELGDKTQLMTIAIAAQYNSPVFILMGTTAGMLVADAIGILGGSWLAKRVPESYIKWGAALIFMLFGIITLYKALPAAYITPLFAGPFILALALLTYLIGFKLGRNKESDAGRTEDKAYQQD